MLLMVQILMNLNLYYFYIFTSLYSHILHYSVLSLPFILSTIRRIPKVIAMHNGKNGVNGPAQNARYAVAITLHHFQPNTAWHKYPPQTGEYITATTITKITTVCQSLHSCHTHLQNFINLVFSLIKNSFIFSIFHILPFEQITLYPIASISIQFQVSPIH